MFYFLTLQQHTNGYNQWNVWRRAFGRMNPHSVVCCVYLLVCPCSWNLVWFVCSSRFPLFQNIWAFLNVLFQLFPPCRALSIAQCHIILEQMHESENIWGDLAHTFMLKLNTAVILQATHSTGLRMTECSEHQRRQESAFLFPTVKHKLTNSSRVRPEERRGWKYLAGRRYDMIDALQTETRSK